MSAFRNGTEMADGKMEKWRIAKLEIGAQHRCGAMVRLACVNKMYFNHEASLRRGLGESLLAERGLY